MSQTLGLGLGLAPAVTLAEDVKRGSKNRNSFQNRVLEINYPKS